MRSFLSTVLNTVVFTVVTILSLSVTQAQVMTSANYKIQSDSINVGGGFSSSTNYISESTIGEVATGKTSSSNYIIEGGYQQMQEVYVAMTVATDVVMDASIGGVTGGTANGSTTVTVTTDSLSGYQLTIAAVNSPAMQKGTDSIADYVPAGAPDYTFVTTAADAHFGYSPEGADVVQRFLDNGVSCNIGSSNTPQTCWDGLSITQEVIAQSSASNHPLGTDTSVLFRVGIGGSVVQPEGVYIATTTLTAVSL